jgi:p-hydroxybenzoate 3-monooxygenase
VKHLKTQVGIVGAGPAGLMLSHLLHLQGIESIVIEDRTRQHVEERVRAGVLEHNTVELMRQTGVGARLDREGLRHDGIHLSFDGKRHHVNMTELVGRSITVYAQHEVIKDLIAARLSARREILFGIEGLTLHDIDTPLPRLRFTHNGEACEMSCDFIGGCDGSHGICREFIPEGVLKSYETTYPYAWLGILAQAAPSSDELVYTQHDRGMALFSMRSPEITRLYLQCSVNEDLAQWPDERIWDELLLRMTTKDGWAPNRGPVIQKGITGMRSLVLEPMQFGRLFLAGDAAHIVPPTGAKGLNLAVADVAVLERGLAAYYRGSRAKGEALLATYSATCLRRVWRVQRFSSWMTAVLHRVDTESEFDSRRRSAELEYLVISRAAMTSLAENYAGLPLEFE